MVRNFDGADAFTLNRSPESVGVITSAEGGLLSNVGATTRTAAARLMPTFEVDPGWPKYPRNGGSEIAGHWLLHRPRTLQPEQAAIAAAPVMAFDPAGNFIGGRLRASMPKMARSSVHGAFLAVRLPTATCP